MWVCLGTTWFILVGFYENQKCSLKVHYRTQGLRRVTKQGLGELVSN